MHKAVKHNSPKMTNNNNNNNNNKTFINVPGVFSFAANWGHTQKKKL